MQAPKYFLGFVMVLHCPVYRSVPGYSRVQVACRASRSGSSCQSTARRSKRAKRRAVKMRSAYLHTANDDDDDDSDDDVVNT